MNRFSRMIVISVGLTLGLAIASLAQGPGQGSGGPMSQMREKYKYTFQLMGMVGHIDEINKQPKYRLSPSQAKQVLATLKPLRSKPKLKQDEAMKTLVNLKRPLTVTQLNAMARIKDKPMFGGGQRQGMGMGQGGPGAGGGRPAGMQGGQRRAFDPNAMKDFNPFYAKPDKKDVRAVQRAKRWDGFFAALEKQANSKPGKFKPTPTLKPKAGKR